MICYSFMLREVLNDMVQPIAFSNKYYLPKDELALVLDMFSTPQLNYELLSHSNLTEFA